MNTTVDELHAAVLSLPEAERARLAARILDSLEQDVAIETAWVSEVGERLAAHNRGEVAAVPSDTGYKSGAATRSEAIVPYLTPPSMMENMRCP